MFGYKSCPQDREVSIDTAKFEGIFLEVRFKDALHGGVTMILRCEISIHHGKRWCAAVPQCFLNKSNTSSGPLKFRCQVLQFLI